MKFLLLALLSLSLYSCAHHDNREPSSVDDDVSRGINADSYYGNMGR